MGGKSHSELYMEIREEWITHPKMRYVLRLAEKMRNEYERAYHYTNHSGY